MKKASFIITGLLLIVGCQGIDSNLTEEQAKAIVMKHHGGTVEIISVTKECNKCIVSWENEENCEWGKDTVNSKGEIEKGETSIC
ncbi:MULTISPECIES: hypothetical protein [Rossellomorea]|uniref:hypothetical protein n=1 Tax=Rossellomorea TaxID=2837508 RepID=UPI001CC92DB4|nr:MULTISPECIES: hypothetical protein [Rossellomorea]MCA0149529.1 hypothetical protein [Rossellomorea vietnamensis]WGG46669.1 hypothetical protein P8596_05440 [Rossellomorea sp. DA94]